MGTTFAFKSIDALGQYDYVELHNMYFLEKYFNKHLKDSKKVIDGIFLENFKKIIDNIRFNEIELINLKILSEFHRSMLWHNDKKDLKKINKYIEKFDNVLSKNINLFLNKKLDKDNLLEIFFNSNLLLKFKQLDIHNSVEVIFRIYENLKDMQAYLKKYETSKVFYFYSV